MRRLKSIVLDLSRPLKWAIVISVDVFCTVFALWLAYYFRTEEFLPLLRQTGEYYPLPALLISVFLSIPIFILFGFYQTIFRYAGLPAIIIVTKAIFVYGLIFALIFTLISVPGVPRSIGILQPILLIAAIFFTRYLARYLLSDIYAESLLVNRMPKTLIYGAGELGCQLAETMADSSEVNIVGFLDDDFTLHKRKLAGLSVYDPTDVEKIIKSQGISEVIIALPSMGRRDRVRIAKSLTKLGLSVREVPSFSDLVRGKISFSDLRELSIYDVLDRDEVPPDLKLINQEIKGQVVLVTGAGGSIGKELCIQIYKEKPKRIVLFDHSEFALHSVYEELLAIGSHTDGVELCPVLASVIDKVKVERVLTEMSPDIVFHSAAYKHVPMVEFNKIAGLKNNAIGTLIMAQAAIKSDIKKFVLISTDKAVRPTNIMGASKRVAEMILQGLAGGAHSTLFGIVRFGNVLESSGSVVPLFKQQIKNGGPVTVTHPDVTRYFMTISEASQLVIQASAMIEWPLQDEHSVLNSKPSAPVYLLDMGVPVKIYNLAQRMITLSGLRVCDEKNREGDLEIKIIGLRPGEKLYEELLITDAVLDTAHPRIKYANESFLIWSELQPKLALLSNAIDNDDEKALCSLMVELVEGFSTDHENLLKSL
jgi:FlaA1/EpsC-like NDP-sugar epimerase